MLTLACFHHVEIFLIKATEDEEQVPTQLTENMLRTHVFCKPLNHVTLR